MSGGEKAQTVDILRACVVDPRDRSRGILRELSRKAISGALCKVQISFIAKLISFHGRRYISCDQLNEEMMNLASKIEYFLSLSLPRNHDILLEAIKLVSNLQYGQCGRAVFFTSRLSTCNCDALLIFVRVGEKYFE